MRVVDPGSSVGPLPDVARLIERAIRAGRARKQAHGCQTVGAIGPLIVGAVRTGGRENARGGRIASRGEAPIAGLGAAAIPLLIGILAQNISLESIPACLVIFYVFLFGMFLLSIRLRKTVVNEA